MMSVRRRLVGLAIVTMTVGTSLGIGAVTAKHVQATLNETPCLPQGILPSPECPTLEGFGVGLGFANAGCPANTTGPCYASGQCYAVPKGHPLTPGAAENGGVISFGGLQVGPITVPPFSEQVPAFNVPAEAAAGGAGACTSAPSQAGGDLTPTVSGMVCEQLFAETATTNTTTNSVSLAWTAYGTSQCNPMIGTVGVGAAQSLQLYPNLPATGSGTVVGNSTNTTYTGLYDAVVHVFGYVDGLPIFAMGCDQSATACGNDVFAV